MLSLVISVFLQKQQMWKGSGNFAMKLISCRKSDTMRDLVSIFLFFEFSKIIVLPVNMLACVTLSDPILLISEYCANGDLLEFLRKKFVQC